MQPPFHIPLAILASTISILILYISISPGNFSYFELHIAVVNVTYSNSYIYRRHQTFIAFFTWVHEERDKKNGSEWAPAHFLPFSDEIFALSRRYYARFMYFFVSYMHSPGCWIWKYFAFAYFYIAILFDRDTPWSSSYCDIKIKMNGYNFACAIVLAYLLNWQKFLAYLIHNVCISVLEKYRRYSRRHVSAGIAFGYNFCNAFR